MKIRFIPEWANMSDISKDYTVKKVEELQATFFNWLVTPDVLTSKTFPIPDRETLFKIFMSIPNVLPNYYEGVLHNVRNYSQVTLKDIYGLELTDNTNLKWLMSTDGETVVASLYEAQKPNGTSFLANDERAAKKNFCAEVFKTLRKCNRVVDANYTESTQFAQHDILTYIYTSILR